MTEPIEVPREAAAPSVRERILEATLEAVAELGVSDLVSAVGVRTIARRAGCSPASIYHHYGSLEGLGEALLAHVYTAIEEPVGQVVPLLDQIRDAQFPLPAAFAMHEADLQRLTTDPLFRMRMGLWALGGPSATVAYRSYLRELDGRIGVALSALFDRWGREPRPPFDVARVVAAHIALINGATLRHHVDPGHFGAEHFKRVGTALSMVLLRVPDDPRDLDARLAELNYYPLPPEAQRAGPRPNDELTARVLQAAAELFAQRGFDETTMEQVARATGLARSSLHARFGSKQAIAVAILCGEARALPVPGFSADPEEDLAEHLALIVTLFTGRPDYVKPYLSSVVSGDQAAADDPIRSTVAIALDRVLPPERADALRDEAADLLVLHLAMRLRREPNLDPLDLARSIVQTWQTRPAPGPAHGSGDGDQLVDGA